MSRPLLTHFLSNLDISHAFVLPVLPLASLLLFVRLLRASLLYASCSFGELLMSAFASPVYVSFLRPHSTRSHHSFPFHPSSRDVLRVRAAGDSHPFAAPKPPIPPNAARRIQSENSCELMPNPLWMFTSS